MSRLMCNALYVCNTVLKLKNWSVHKKHTYIHTNYHPPSWPFIHLTSLDIHMPVRCHTEPITNAFFQPSFFLVETENFCYSCSCSNPFLYNSHLSSLFYFLPKTHPRGIQWGGSGTYQGTESFKILYIVKSTSTHFYEHSASLIPFTIFF